MNNNHPNCILMFNKIGVYLQQIGVFAFRILSQFPLEY